jgi:hypothetical protein
VTKNASQVAQIRGNEGLSKKKIENLQEELQKWTTHKVAIEREPCFSSAAYISFVSDDGYICNIRQVGHTSVLRAVNLPETVSRNRTLKHFERKAEATLDQAAKDQVAAVMEKVGVISRYKRRH